MNKNNIILWICCLIFSEIFLDITIVTYVGKTTTIYNYYSQIIFAYIMYGFAIIGLAYMLQLVVSNILFREVKKS